MLTGFAGCRLVKKQGKLSERRIYENSYLFVGALQLKLTGRIDEALVVFMKIAEADPWHAASRYEIARLYAEKKEYIPAMDFAKQAIKIHPKNKWYRLLLIDIYDRTGEYKSEIPLYNQLIKEFPNDMSLYYGLSGAYLKTNNLNGAIDVLNDVESKTGISEEISLRKYQYYLMYGNNKAAIEEIKKLATAFPGEPAYAMAIGDFFLQSGNYYEALSHYSAVYEKDNMNYEALISLAECYMRIGNRAKATELFTSLFRDPTVDIDAKMNIVLYYYEVSENDSALTAQAYRLLEIYDKTHPENAKVYSVYGDFLFRDKNFAGAAVKWQKVIAVDPSKYPVWDHLLICYDMLEDYISMERTAREACEYFPEQAGSHFYAGYAMYMQKKYDLCIAFLTEAFETSVSDKTLQVRALGYVAEAHIKLKAYELSDSAFEKLLVLDPKNNWALNNYSYYLALRGSNLDKALSMSVKTVKSNPKSSTYLDTYGWILYQLGRYSDAKEYLEKALEYSAEPDPEILQHLGDVLFQLGQFDECLRYWKLAIDAGGDITELNKRIEQVR
jgi:tetratricopeptide (TPR) repeat protein